MTFSTEPSHLLFLSGIFDLSKHQYFDQASMKDIKFQLPKSQDCPHLLRKNQVMSQEKDVTLIK